MQGLPGRGPDGATWWQAEASDARHGGGGHRGRHRACSPARPARRTISSSASATASPTASACRRAPTWRSSPLPSGDDVSLGGSILSGTNGICESALGGDDQRPPNGVILNAGLPDAPIIRSGTPGGPDTICHDTIVPVGDDVVLVAPGNSKPLQLGIIAGPNGSIQSTAGGDDVLTAIICPGVDGTFQSIAEPRRRIPRQQRPLRRLPQLDLVHHPRCRCASCRPPPIRPTCSRRSS